MQESYFDHEADIGIIGRGKTLEECFSNSAWVMFSILTDLTKVEAKQTIQFEFEETNLELALVTWLNLLIGKANAMHMIFSQFNITRANAKWHCRVSGEKWNDNMEHGTDVKGATLTMLSVANIDGIWEARCVLDV